VARLSILPYSERQMFIKRRKGNRIKKRWRMKRSPEEENLLRLFESMTRSEFSNYEQRLLGVLREAKPIPDLKEAKQLFATYTIEEKREFLFSLCDKHMRIDHRKVSQFEYEAEDEAVEQIVEALRERNGASTNKEWTDDKYYEHARSIFTWAQKIKRAMRPEVLDSYLVKHISHITRSSLKVALSTDAPKKRPGRKKTKHLRVINGGWNRKWPGNVLWTAKDLSIKSA
jgi:hypothetical protein